MNCCEPEACVFVKRHSLLSIAVVVNAKPKIFRIFYAKYISRIVPRI